MPTEALLFLFTDYPAALFKKKKHNSKGIGYSYFSKELWVSFLAVPSCTWKSSCVVQFLKVIVNVTIY